MDVTTALLRLAGKTIALLSILFICILIINRWPTIVGYFQPDVTLIEPLDEYTLVRVAIDQMFRPGAELCDNLRRPTLILRLPEQPVGEQKWECRTTVVELKLLKQAHDLFSAGRRECLELLPTFPRYGPVRAYERACRFGQTHEPFETVLTRYLYETRGEDLESGRCRPIGSAKCKRYSDNVGKLVSHFYSRLAESSGGQPTPNPPSPLGPPEPPEAHVEE